MKELKKLQIEREKFLEKQEKNKKRTTWTPNDILIYDEYAEIILRNKKQNICGITKVDLDDLDLVKKYKWGGHKLGYPFSRHNGKSVMMHRILLNFPKGTIDHLNRNKMDNRRANLRITTLRENFENYTPLKERKQKIFFVNDLVNDLVNRNVEKK